MAQILAKELPKDSLEWVKPCAADVLAMGLHWPMMAGRLLNTSSCLCPDYNQVKMSIGRYGPMEGPQECCRWACNGPVPANELPNEGLEWANYSQRISWR